MAIAAQRVQLYPPASQPVCVAPLVEGAAFTSYTIKNAENGTGGTNTSFSGRRGARIVLPVPQDITTHQFISFLLYQESFGMPTRLATIANGGIRFILVDGTGNYAGYNIYGSDIPGIAESGPAVEGMLSQFVVIREFNVPHFFIDHSRTPDISSGVLDKTNIVAIEFSINNATSFASSLWLAQLSKNNINLATGTSNNTFVDFANTLSAGQTNKMFLRLPWYQQSTAGLSFFTNIGFRIGNGSTTTTLNESFFNIGLQNTYDQSPAFRSVGPILQLNDANTGRGIYINQSASDVVTLTDGSIASAAWWEWEVTGSTSGTVTCTRVQFWRYSKFVAGHGQYIECQFNGASAPVEVNGTSVILDGVIRDATTTALKVNTGPAIYDDLSLRFNNPTATADIELGSGGAGTYELPNIEVPAGYTLKIRNNSATNAITVAIPTGITFSTSTAGGTITVQTPSVTATGQITGIFAGSRLQVFNQTTNTEVFNGIISGTGYSNTYTEGTTFAAGDIVRVRLAYQSGTTAKVPVQYRTVATAAGWSILADQQDDTVYIQNAINGDTVTEFTEDFPNVQIDVNDPDGVTTVQRGYAWYISGQMTADGIRFFHGGMTAEDDVNYRINVDIVNMTIQNVNVNPLRVIGGRLYRSDGSTAITPGGGGVQMEYGRAYAVETGVSGLTPAESDRLMQSALQTTAADAARNAALAAALSA